MIDSSVMIAAFERRSASAIEAITALGQHAVRSFVVHGELASGVAATASDQPDALRLRSATLAAFLRLTIEPSAALDVSVLADHYGFLTAKCSELQIKSGQNDRWILSEAIQRRLSVLTADVAMHELGSVATEQLHLDPPLTTFVEG